MRGLTTSRKRRREGAAAVEFALVGPPFFLLLFAVLELGILFSIDSLLEGATWEASRLVRTGQGDAKGFTQAAFKQQVCNRMSAFKDDCMANATVDVQVLKQFASPDVETPWKNGKFDPSQTRYEGGQPGDLILIRVWYARKMIMPMVAQAMKPNGDGKMLLNATAAFRNEPWQ